MIQWTVNPGLMLLLLNTKFQTFLPAYMDLRNCNVFFEPHELSIGH